MYKNILVAVDIDDISSVDILIKKVLEFKKTTPDLQVNFLHIVQTFINLVEDFFPKEWIDNVQEKSLLELEKIVKKHFGSDKNVSCFAEQGAIYEHIINKADELKADLIIVTAHSSDRYDYNLGPNAASVVRYARTSVFVIRGSK